MKKTSEEKVEIDPKTVDLLILIMGGRMFMQLMNEIDPKMLDNIRAQIKEKMETFKKAPA